MLKRPRITPTPVTPEQRWRGCSATQLADRRAHRRAVGLQRRRGVVQLQKGPGRAGDLLPAASAPDPFAAATHVASGVIYRGGATTVLMRRTGRQRNRLCRRRLCGCGDCAVVVQVRHRPAEAQAKGVVAQGFRRTLPCRSFLGRRDVLLPMVLALQ